MESLSRSGTPLFERRRASLRAFYFHYFQLCQVFNTFLQRRKNSISANTNRFNFTSGIFSPLGRGSCPERNVETGLSDWRNLAALSFSISRTIFRLFSDLGVRAKDLEGALREFRRRSFPAVLATGFDSTALGDWE